MNEHLNQDTLEVNLSLADINPSMRRAFIQTEAMNCAVTDPGFLGNDEQTMAQELVPYWHHMAPDPAGGQRKRFQRQGNYSTKDRRITFGRSQAYRQYLHDTAPGQDRFYSVAPDEFVNNRSLKQVVSACATFGEFSDPELFAQDKLEVGLHGIRYEPYGPLAAVSTPAFAHRDDEKLVFVVLIHVTEGLEGGHNLFPKAPGDKHLSLQYKMQRPLETVILTNRVLHAVTPMAANGRDQYRDILIVTFHDGKKPVVS